MLFDRLCEYYGPADAETEKYVTKCQEGMSEDTQVEVFDKIIRSRQRRFGFPDIAFLSSILQAKGATTTGKKYYWSVCFDCGLEFDYSFYTCPKCYKDRDHRSSGYFVRTSDTFNKNVYRWNLPVFSKGNESEKICMECENKEKGFCFHFGDHNYQCDRQTFEYCQCKSCCIKYKKMARAMEERTEGCAKK